MCEEHIAPLSTLLQISVLSQHFTTLLLFLETVDWHNSAHCPASC